jgi:hypothetical protein
VKAKIKYISHYSARGRKKIIFIYLFGGGVKGSNFPITIQIATAKNSSENVYNINGTSRMAANFILVWH